MPVTVGHNVIKLMGMTAMVRRYSVYQAMHTGIVCIHDSNNIDTYRRKNNSYSSN